MIDKVKKVIILGIMLALIITFVITFISKNRKVKLPNNPCENNADITRVEDNIEKLNVPEDDLTDYDNSISNSYFEELGKIVIDTSKVENQTKETDVTVQDTQHNDDIDGDLLSSIETPEDIFEEN